MDFRILGSVEVSSEGLTLHLSGPRQRALLAYLLLHANEVVPAERLLDELWVEAPRGGVAALQTQVSRLRRIVGERLQTVDSGYCVRVEPGELDFERFRSLLAEAGATAEPAARARLLLEAEGLWRGEPLAGLDVPFAAAERAALEELRLGAIEERLAATLESGGGADIVAELSALVAHHPLRERLRAQLILALYRSDRQADALDAFRETRRMLDEELGLEPSPALRELERAILRQDPALDAITPAPTVSQDAVAQPTRRRRLPLVAATLVVLGSAAGAAFAAVMLTGGGGGQPRAQAKQPARVVVRPAVRPAHRKVGHHTRIRAWPRATPTRIVKRTVPHRTAKPKPSAARNTPPAQTTATKAKPATTTTKAVVATKTVPRRPSAPPKVVTISDAFDSDIVDPTIWHQITTDANVSIAETGGQLLVTVGPAAIRAGTYNQIDVHVGTQCKFPGDFDARVDFALLEWPPNDNIIVGLGAIFAGSVVGRSSSSQWGDQYVGWVVPGSNGSVPLTDVSGSLRIARVHGIETTYIWHRGGWVSLAAGYSQGAAVFGLQAMSPDSSSAFGRQELKVAFDNFTVTGDDPVCPPGSQPNG